jgi:hypothetical protein
LRKLALLFLILVAGPTFAQTTNVSGTVADTTSQAFAYGTWKAQLVGPSGYTGNFFYNGTQLGQSDIQKSGTLNASGAMSTTAMYSNNVIAINGGIKNVTLWTFTVCPGASASCFSISLNITGASYSITGNIVPTAISVPANNLNQPSAYSDSEISGGVLGFAYFNLTDQTLHICGPPACTWIDVGGSGVTGFNTITSGTNTSAAMVVGTGSSLTVSGTGTISATGTVTSPTDCSAGSAPRGIDSSFNASGCAVLLTPAGSNGDVQMKSSSALSASAINDNGSRVLDTEDTFFKSGTPWFDIKAFGSVCDGATNDTTDINNSYTAANTSPGGGAVYFPHSSGACKFGTLTIPSSPGAQGWLVSTFDNSILGNQIIIGSNNAFRGQSGSTLGLSGSFVYGPYSTWEQAGGATTDFVDLNAVNQNWFEGINFEANDASNTIATVHSHDTGGGCIPNCAGSTWITLFRSAINAPQTTTAPAFLSDSSANTQISGFGFRAQYSTFAAGSGAPYSMIFKNLGNIVIQNSAVQGAGILIQNNGIGSDGGFLGNDILSESIPANQPFLTLNSTSAVVSDISLEHISLADANANVYMVKNIGTQTNGLNFDTELAGNIGSGLIDPTSTAGGINGVFCKSIGCESILTQAGAAMNNAFIFPYNGRPAVFYQTAAQFDAFDVTGNASGFPDLGFHQTLGLEFGDSTHFGYSARISQPSAENLGAFIAQAMPPTTFTATPAGGGSLANGTYFYIVRSLLTGSNCNTANQSAFSTEVSVTLTGANGTVTLAWTPGIGNFAGYCVYRGTVSLNESTVYFVNTQAATGFSDIGSAGTTLFIGNNINGTFPSTAQFTFNLGGVDILEIATPANPAAGYERWYPSSATHQFACLTSGGISCAPGSFYQTIQANGTPQTQEATANYVAGANMTITPTTVGGVTTLTFTASSTAATAWSSLTASTNSNSGTFASSGNSWDFSAATSFKVPTEGLIFPGSSSGSVTVVAQSAAGTPTVTWGTSNGTPVVTASLPLSITAATGNETIANATTGAVGVVELAGDFAGTGTSPTVVSTHITGGTTNTISKFNATGNMVNSSMVDNGTLITFSEQLDLTSQALTMEIANASSTGTTVNTFASLTGAPTTAVITTANTTGAAGIVASGAGTTGNAQIAVLGQVNCVFDGGTTANHFVSQSATVNGDCTDAGVTAPANMPAIKVLSTNASAGTYAVVILGGGGGSGSGSGTVNNCATSGAVAYYASNGTAVSCLPSITESAGVLSIGIAGTTAGQIKLSGSTSGTITLQTQNAAGTFNWNYPTTAGTSGFLLTSGGGGSSPMTWTSSTVTVNSQSCTLAGSCTLPFITNGNGGNISQAGLELDSSASNSIGGIITVTNTVTNKDKFELTGTINPTGGGTGISNPTAHSLLVAEGASNMNLVTSPIVNGTYLCGFFVTGSAAVDPTCNAIGVPVNAQTGVSYTIAASDRASDVSMNNAGAVAVTLPQAGSTGFGSNFPFLLPDLGVGAATITPTTSTINGASSLLVPQYWVAFTYSDNTNYTSYRFPDYRAFANSGSNAALTFNSATGAFGTLSNIVNCAGSTAGDICYWNGSAWTRFAGNSSGTQALEENASGVPSWVTVGGSGTVTSVGLTVNSTSPSGIFTVTGSPVTSTGTLNFNLAGTSGGVPYFSSATVLSSSAALAANAVVIGGGAGAAPSTISADTTTTHALFATATAPAFRAIVAGDLPNIPLNQVISPTGAITEIQDGNNPLVISSAQTTSGQVAVTFDEHTAATSAGTPYEVEIATAAGSTATPLEVVNSLTGSQTLPTVSILPVWNTTGVATALLINPANTASGTGSLLIQAQTGGTNEFTLDKSGNGVFTAGITGTSLTLSAQETFNETTAPSASSTNDICYGDSTLHGLKCSYNNGSFLPLPLSTGTITSGGLTYDSGSSGSLIASSPDFTISSHTLTGGASGILDMTAGTLKIPSSAGCTSNGTSSICYDTTNKNTHQPVNGADALSVGEASAITANIIPKSGSSTIALMTPSLLSDNGTALSYTGTGGGDFTAGTLTVGAAAAICTPGTGGGLCMTEGTAATPAAGQDILIANVFYHTPMVSTNGGSFYGVQINQLVTETANYTASVNDSAILCTGTFTTTLPASGVPVGKTYRLKNTGTGTCTLATGNLSTIDGSSTAVLAVQYASIDVIFDGTNWWVF